MYFTSMVLIPVDFRPIKNVRSGKPKRPGIISCGYQLVISKRADWELPSSFLLLNLFFPSRFCRALSLHVPFLPACHLQNS
uniref:Uncharacterized protein n=1 Tax=Aegilops tauschii subsp. strangulata TaxID=200361 RepID=A0A452YY93_AEGTS